MKTPSRGYARRLTPRNRHTGKEFDAMEMVSAALPSASFKLLGVMPYAAKPSPVSTSLTTIRQGGLSMEEAWRLFSSKSWPQGVWRMDRQGSWQTISITSNSLVTEVPIIQGGRSLPHHSTTLGNCIGLINIYGRFSLSWKCNVFRYHCNYFVVLSGVGNCMGLESCDCHDEKKRIKNAHCIVCAQACGSRT